MRATKSLAIEYAARGIQVNTISPGVINLPMRAGADDAALAQLRQMGHPRQISRRRRGSPVLRSAPFVTGGIPAYRQGPEYRH